MINYRRKYKHHLEKYVVFSTSEGRVKGKLLDIRGTCFLFKPYVQYFPVREDGRIFEKSSLEDKTLEMYINNPKTNIGFSETTKEEIEESCRLNNIVQKNSSPKIKEDNQRIGL